MTCECGRATASCRPRRRYASGSTPRRRRRPSRARSPGRRPSSPAATRAIAAEASDADSGVVSRTLRRRAATPTGLMSCEGATFSNDGDAVRVTGTGPYSVSIPRSGTCYQWVLTATDKAGNPTSARSGAVWIDTSGPMAPVLETTGDAGVRGSTIWFRDAHIRRLRAVRGVARSAVGHRLAVHRTDLRQWLDQRDPTPLTVDDGAGPGPGRATSSSRGMPARLPCRSRPSMVSVAAG